MTTLQNWSITRCYDANNNSKLCWYNQKTLLNAVNQLLRIKYLMDYLEQF